MAKKGFFRRIVERVTETVKAPFVKKVEQPEKSRAAEISLRKPVSFKKSEDWQLEGDEFRTLDEALDYASSLPDSRKVIIAAYGQLSRPNDYNNPIGWGNLSERWATPGLAGRDAYRQRMLDRQNGIFDRVSKYHVINEARGN